MFKGYVISKLKNKIKNHATSINKNGITRKRRPKSKIFTEYFLFKIKFLSDMYCLK